MQFYLSHEFMQPVYLFVPEALNFRFRWGNIICSGIEQLSSGQMEQMIDMPLGVNGDGIPPPCCSAAIADVEIGFRGVYLTKPPVRYAYSASVHPPIIKNKMLLF